MPIDHASPLDTELNPPPHLKEILARVHVLYRDEVVPREGMPMANYIQRSLLLDEKSCARPVESAFTARIYQLIWAVADSAAPT